MAPRPRPADRTPLSSTMDNSKVKQQLSQALSNTEGLTTYVKGYLQCVDERIALDGRPLASAANVDGLIQDILDNDRANKDKLAIIKRELLRKIKQKTKLQFFVQIMQKRTEELIQQGAAIKEVGKVWPQLGPDVDFSGMLSSMQSVADGEKDKVAEKENELAVLRQELNSLQDGQKPGVKLPESKTMVGVQVHVMDKQDCRDDLKKAEKSWLRQVSTTLERDPSRVPTYSRSAQEISDVHDQIKSARQQRDNLIERLRELNDKNLEIHRDLLERINRRKELENNSVELCLAVEENTGAKLRFDASCADWGVNVGDQTVRRNDRLSSDLGDAYAQALAAYETNLRRLLDIRNRIGMGADSRPSSAGVGRRIAESAGRDAELEELAKLTEQCRLDAERLNKMLAEREQRDEENMKRRLMRRMNVQMMTQFGNTVILGSGTMGDQLRALDELGIIKRRLLSEIDDIDEKIAAIKRELDQRPDKATADALEKRLNQLMARKKELNIELEDCKKRWRQIEEAGGDPAFIERNILRMDFEFKQHVNAAGQLTRENVKLKLAAGKQVDDAEELKKELGDKQVFNKRLIERAAALKDTIKHKLVELNCERERHIYHAAPRWPVEGESVPVDQIRDGQLLHDERPWDFGRDGLPREEPPSDLRRQIPDSEAGAGAPGAPGTKTTVKDMRTRKSILDALKTTKTKRVVGQLYNETWSEFEADEGLFKEIYGDMPAEVTVDVPEINIKMIRKKRLRTEATKKTTKKVTTGRSKSSLSEKRTE